MAISLENDIIPMIKKLEELIGLSFKVFLVTALVVTILGIYIANLLFGNHSLQVLQNLKKERHHLQVEIETIKQENAKLHKKLLEWSDV